MTPFQEIVIGKLIVFVEEDPGSLEESRSFTRRECMELLGLIDRLRVKAEGGRPPKQTTRPSAAAVAFEEAGWMPPATRPFDGTFPPKEGERTAGYKEPPAPGTGDAT